MKRKPLGHHDGNRQEPKRRTSLPRSPSINAFSRRKSISLSKPPLPPRSSTKKSTLKPPRLSNGFDGSSKTPRINNLEKSRHGSTARALDRSYTRTSQEYAAAGSSIGHPTQETSRHVDMKLQTRDQIAGGTTKKGKGPLHTLAHVSNSSASGTKGPPSSFRNKSHDTVRDKPQKKNVATEYLLSGRASHKKPSVLKKEYVHEALSEPKTELKLRSRDLSVPSSKKEESMGVMDCDSDDQSLGLSSPESPLPRNRRPGKEQAVDQDKDWTLTIPHENEGHAKVVDNEWEDDADRNSVLQSALCYDATQKQHSTTPRKGGKSSTNAQDDRSHVTERMMRRAREADLDNREAITAMLASHPSNGEQDHTRQSSSMVGAHLEVKNYQSGDESELTMHTLQDDEEDVDGGSRKRRRERRDDDPTSRSYGFQEQARPTSAALISGSRAERSGPHSDGSQRDNQHRESREGSEPYKNPPAYNRAWLHERQTSSKGFPGSKNHFEETDEVSTKSRELWASHPPLPPGWDIKFSTTKHKIYYVHPEKGATWWCPVPLPDGEASFAGVEAESRLESGKHQVSTSELGGRSSGEIERGNTIEKSFENEAGHAGKAALTQEESKQNADREPSREETLGALLEALNEDYDADDEPEASSLQSATKESPSRERALGVDPKSPYEKNDGSNEADDSMPIDETAGVSPGFVVDQSPIEHAEEIVTTLHLKCNKGKDDIAEIVNRTGSKKSDTKRTGHVAEREERDEPEVNETSFDRFGDGGDDLTVDTEEPFPQDTGKGETPLQYQDFDLPVGAEESVDSSECERRMGIDWQLEPESEVKDTATQARITSTVRNSSPRNRDMDSSNGFNDAGNDDKNSFSSSPKYQSRNSSVYNDGFSNSDSKPSPPNSQSSSNSIESRRRLSRGYSKTSSISRSANSSLTKTEAPVRRHQTAKYRPSWRVTNPRDPLCSLQRLFLYAKHSEVSPESDRSDMASSSKKNRQRRSGNRIHALRKRLW